MIDLPVIIAIAAFLAVFLLVGAALYYIQYSAQRRRLLNKITDEPQPSMTAEPEPAPEGLIEHMRHLVVNFARSTGDHIKPKEAELRSGIELKFLRAGYRDRNAATAYWGAKALLAISLPMALVILKAVMIHKPIDLFVFMIILIFSALAGSYLPDLWLNHKMNARREKLTEGFPDALDLMVVCVEAGMSLDAAIHRVGEEMRFSNTPMSDELILTNLELRAGKTRRDAMKNLSRRTNIEDIESLVNLLIQTDRFGTSIADALRTHSEFMRQKRFQRAEEMAMKIPVKILFPMLFCVFPTIFIIILGPPLIQAYRLWNAAH